MTTIDYLHPATVPPPGGAVAALWRKIRAGRRPWGLADQVLISGANFLTVVFAARGLGKAALGEFALVYNVLLFANLIQMSLVSQPHNVLGSGRGGGRAYASYTASTAAQQIALTLLESLIALAFVLVAHARGWGCEGLLLALVPAIAAWSLQEFVRRILYTEGRLAAAFANDVISYGGQAVWIIALWWLDLGKPAGAAHWLTGPSALWALAITSAAGAALGCWQVRKSLLGRLDWKVWAENWHFGKWLVGSEMLVYFSSLPAYMYLCGWLIGPASSGELKAAQTLFGPTRIISYYFATVLPIQFARRLTEGGDAALRRQLRTTALQVLPIVGGVCLLIALCAAPLLLIFGRDFAAEPSVLAMYALVTFFAYIQMVLAAALTARRQTRHVFLGTVGGAIVTAVLSCALIRLMGIHGALVGMLLTGMAIAALMWRGYRSGAVASGARLSGSLSPVLRGEG
jgi:O-antigen/teichoic acid export membrane protein